MFFLSRWLLTVMFQGGKSRKGKNTTDKGKKDQKKIHKEKSLCVEILMAHTLFTAFKNIITNQPDLLSINCMNVRTRNGTSMNFRKSEMFLTLNIFTAIYSQRTGNINNLRLAAALNHMPKIAFSH